MRRANPERQDAAACPPLTQAVQGIEAARHAPRMAMRAASAIIRVHSSDSPNEAAALSVSSTAPPVHKRTRDGASHRHG